MSFKAALDDPTADTGKDTQFYTMLGTRGIWHDGWFANTVHAATPAGWSHFDEDRWELFHIEADRSQCHDLAAEQPDKLEELKALWFAEAAKYNGLPLADLNILETLMRSRPYLVGRPQDSFTYYPDCAEVGHRRRRRTPRPVVLGAGRGRPSTPPAPRACCSSRAARTAGTCCSSRTVGCTTSTTSWASEEQEVSSPERGAAGQHMFGVRYDRTGTVEDSHTPLGDVTLYIDDDAVGTLPACRRIRAPSGWRAPASPSGATAVRRCRVATRRRSRSPAAPSRRSIVDLSGRPYVDVERELALAFSRD